MKGRNLLRNWDIDRRMILKWIVNEWNIKAISLQAWTGP